MTNIYGTFQKIYLFYLQVFSDGNIFQKHIK